MTVNDWRSSDRMLKTEDTDISNAVQHSGDVNSKTIFSNPVLMGQFLRDYIKLPIFADVKPEDIEDVTDRYRAFLGIEFGNDTVKKVKVRTKDKGKEYREVYVIPLIEHKSDVDYDVPMQLLRYMALIWYDHAKLHKKEHHRKYFRYPLILPIVYYEGADNWTADLNFQNRIEHIKGMEQFVPKFEYEVVECHGYSNEELQRHSNEMALIMLLNKIQTAEDFSLFLQTSKDGMKDVLPKASKDIQDIIKEVLWSILMKMGVPVEEAHTAMKYLEAGHMGYLFEHMENMDIKKERQKTKEAEERARREKARADKSEAVISQAVSFLIRQHRRNGSTKEQVVADLKSMFDFDEETAKQDIERYW